MFLYKLLLHVLIGVCICIYATFYPYISVIMFIILVCVNLFGASRKSIENIKAMILGIFLSFASMFVHAIIDNRKAECGIISYIGNECVFLEGMGMYYVNSREVLQLGDEISFNAHGSYIKNITKKTRGDVFCKFLVNHRQYIKSLIIKSKYYDFWIAILLGDKSYIKNNDLRNLLESSTYHLIVISGFHLSLIYNCVYYLVNLLTKRSKIINYYSTIYFSYDIIPHFFATCVVVYYFLLCLSGVSALRAVVMILLRKSKYSPKSVLMFLAILSLMYNPALLFNKGFILSYTITFLLLEKQSNIKVTLFSSMITGNVNPFALFNNLIGTSIMYMLLLIGFISILVNKASILDVFNPLIDVLVHHLPKVNLSIGRWRYLINVVVVFSAMYLQYMNSKYLYIAFGFFIIAILSNLIN
jgi:predicted membrane metal-binding protein